MMNKMVAAIIMIVVFACHSLAAQDKNALNNAKITEDASVVAFNLSAKIVLNECKALIEDPRLTEEQLNGCLTKIEALIVQIEHVQAEKTKLNDAELTSTLGVLYVRKAGFNTSDPHQAGLLASMGYRYLDRARIKYPENITVRINRGMTSALVPEFMHKTEVAREDLDFVINSPSFAHLPVELQTSIQSMQSEVYRRLEQGTN